MTDCVHPLPVSAKHRWNLEHRIPAIESPDGNNRTEKTCPFCGLVKITIHYPNGKYPGRSWRTKDGRVFDQDRVPASCIGVARA